MPRGEFSRRLRDSFPAECSGSFFRSSEGFWGQWGPPWANAAETLRGWGSRPTHLGKIGHGGGTGLTGGYQGFGGFPSSRGKGHSV